MHPVQKGDGDIVLLLHSPFSSGWWVTLPLRHPNRSGSMLKPAWARFCFAGVRHVTEAIMPTQARDTEPSVRFRACSESVRDPFRNARDLVREASYPFLESPEPFRCVPDHFGVAFDLSPCPRRRLKLKLVCPQIVE